MSSHAFAIGMSAFAYAAARKYADDARFAFGTWKIEILGGFASAIFLLGVALVMVIGSIERIVSPQPIHYQSHRRRHPGSGGQSRLRHDTGQGPSSRP